MCFMIYLILGNNNGFTLGLLTCLSKMKTHFAIVTVVKNQTLLL